MRVPPEERPVRRATKSPAERTPELVAALDLGSNSFHLVVCRCTEAGPQVIERLRDQVQIRAGLDASGRIAPDSIERALSAVRRFAQWLEPRPELLARVVATNTFRVARNGEDLRRRIEEELGRPIEIISAEEEARLIHLGVSHTMPTHGHPAFIFDIGGGSTECILGLGARMHDWRSFEMGCVSWSTRFFPNGEVTRAAMDSARSAAEAVLGPLAMEWREQRLDGRYIGTSGTVRSAERILRTNGWTTHGLTREGLARAIKAVVKAGRCDGGVLPGLKRSRANVFFGGLVILDAIFQAFDIERLEVSHGALREGIVYELIGAVPSDDLRERSLERMAARYHVDVAQADRVRDVALQLYAGAAKAFGIADPDLREALREAAILHEIGLSLSQRHHHLHAAYLLANTELPGTSTRDRALLAALVGGQRGRLDRAPFRRIEGLQVGEGSLYFESLAPFVGGLLDERSAELEQALRLALLLRLAVVLCRDRKDDLPTPLELEVSGVALNVRLPRAWWEARPLTREEFRSEAQAFEAIGYRLQVRPQG